MQYFLNGGRDERGVLRHPAALALYQRLQVKRLLIIPYAVVEDEWQRLWHESGDMFRTPNLEIKSLSTYDTNLQDIAERIAWADFIYLTGGSQKTLLRRLNELGTSELLLGAVKSNDFKLIGGGSAGAMVMGSECLVGRDEVSEVIPGSGILDGMIIDSHFSNRNRESRLTAILNKKQSLTGIGIDENTGLVLDEQAQVSEVFGDGAVSIYKGNDKKIYDSNT